MKNTAPWLSGLRLMLVAVCVLIVCYSFSASAQRHTHRKVVSPAVKQGICGTIIEKRGNQMPRVDAPGVDSHKTAAGGTPVGREVLIFPLLNLSQVDAGDNGFINSVRDAKPIKTIQSDKSGKFCINLPVGRYSVLVREPKGLYANLSDTQNNIFPVTVQKNRQSAITVEITHQAVF